MSNNEKETTLIQEQLISPLEFYFHDPVEKEASGDPGDLNGVYGLYDIRYRISGVEAMEFIDDIELAIRRDYDSMNKIRGMAEYLPDELQDKVHSMFPSIEFHDDELYCVTSVELNEPLTADEMALLKDAWDSQLADGWGEGFGQQEIKLGQTELYVVPWTSDGTFFIDTQHEFMRRLGMEVEMPLMEAKLYSPVFVDFWEYNEHGDTRAYSEELHQRYASFMFDEIQTAILNERLPEEAERGLMKYYFDADSINEKVKSMHVDVEVINEKLWAVSNIKVTESLTVEELDTLRNYITGQFSDGFGEGFEQRDIKIDGGEINVHLWKRSDEFFIDTQAQFSERIGVELPDDVLSQPALPTSPAQAMPSEDVVSNDEIISGLRQHLEERLNKNLSDYFDKLKSMDSTKMCDISSEIASYANAHFYLTEAHNFQLSELTYLLAFQNPLEVVADAFEADGLEGRSDIMWEIFDSKAALNKNYALVGFEDKVSEKPTEKSTKKEYTSVLEHIRRDKKERRNNPSTPQVPSASKKKSKDEEL